MKKKVPNIFKPILWSYSLDKIDPERHKKLLITQAINYGDLPHWEWLARHYGKKEVLAVVRQSRAQSIRPTAHRLAMLLMR